MKVLICMMLEDFSFGMHDINVIPIEEKKHSIQILSN